MAEASANRQERPRNSLIYGALLAVTVINCGYNVLSKNVLSSHVTTKADPLIFSLVRDLTAFPLLQVGALLVDGALLPDLKDVPLIALLGLLGMFGNQYLFIYGLAGKDVTATEAAVLSQTQPVFAALLALTAKQIRPSWALAGGVLLTFGGSLVMAKVWTIKQIGGEDTVHLAALLLGALCMALYYVAQKPILNRYPPLSLTAWAYFFGALSMGLASLSYFALPDGEMQEKWNSLWTQPTIIALVFAVIMNSVLKYALQSFANKWVGATTLTVWMCLVPIFTAIVGVSWLGEKPGYSYLGAVPVMIGVYLVTVARQTVAPQTETGLLEEGEGGEQARDCCAK